MNKVFKGYESKDKMENKSKQIKDKHFYFLIFLMAVYFVVRLIDEYKIVNYFPLAKNFDLSAHLGQLYLTVNYGFHSFVPLWYNGITLFQVYYPAWYYFTLPFYYVVKDVSLATFISLVAILFLGFFVIYFGLKRLSFIKKIAFFLLFFANPIFISYILRIGRVTEMFSWLIYITFFLFLYNYINRRLDYRFVVFFVLIYSILLLSHFTTFFLSLLLIASFLLIRRNLKTYTFISISLILFLLITSFWWIPFYKNIQNTPAQGLFESRWLISDDPQWIFDKVTTILTSITLIFFFFLSYRNNLNKLFFIPQIILAFLVLIRLIVHIPILNRVPPDTFNILFIWCSLFLFFSLDLNKINKFVTRLFILFLYILPVIMVIFSALYTPWVPEHTQEQKGILDLISYVNYKFIFASLDSLKECPDAFSCTHDNFYYYNYATIKYNISTSLGGTPVLISNKVVDDNYSLLKSIVEKDCEKLNNYMVKLGVVDIVATYDGCDTLKTCNLNLKNRNFVGCVYSLM